MSVKDQKQWKDLQELRKIYSLKDARTPSGSLTAHGLRLERVLEGYRKDIQELNRLLALEDPRSAVPRADAPRADAPRADAPRADVLPKENR